MSFGYVSPEQSMRDRADFARKGIARGGSVIVLTYVDGIVLVAENRSRALHKVSEIYDRLAFAAIGKYNEFENLRIAGIRIADLRGYGYDRRDVTGRSLANAYAQALGTIFTTEPKPYEVELMVAEVGETSEGDQIYRLTYDGSVADERSFAVMGGAADRIQHVLEAGFRPGLSLAEAVQLSVNALQEDGEGARTLTQDLLEVAVLDRTRQRARKFARVGRERLASLFAGNDPHDVSGDTPTPSVGPGVDALAPEAPAPGAGYGASTPATADDEDKDPDVPEPM
jgi:proteasome alpha subunit